VPGINHPLDEGFMRHIADLERRISELETTPALNNAQIAVGTFQAVDAAGNVRVQVGLIPDGLGTYGFRTLNAAGVELFRTDDRGIVAPGEALQSQPALAMNANGEEVDITTALMIDAFVALWSPPVGAQGLIVTVPWITDAGTTGAIQLASSGGGNTPTATQALPAASSGTHVAHWLHGVPLGTTGVQFAVLAQRTGGAGNVRILIPTVQFIGPVGMAANGGWT
jgi:hypothetical protein